MPRRTKLLTQDEYERFCEEVAAGAALCTEVQLLALTSQITNSLRRRRAGVDERSFASSIRGSSLGLR